MCRGRKEDGTAWTHGVTLSKALKGAVWAEATLPSFGTIPGLLPERLRLCPAPRHEVQMKTRRVEKQQKPHHPVLVAIWWALETIGIFSYYVYTAGRTHTVCPRLPQGKQCLYFPGFLRNPRSQPLYTPMG